MLVINQLDTARTTGTNVFLDAGKHFVQKKGALPKQRTPTPTEKQNLGLSPNNPADQSMLLSHV